MTHLVLLALCAHRIWRFVGRDEITAPLRARLFGDETLPKPGLRGWFADMVTCEWCLGTWTALGLVAYDHFHPVAMWALLLGAVASLVGFLGSTDARLNR